MGTVVLHAGMGKAGSSSIQWWLAGNAGRLKESGISLLVARPGDAPGERLRLTEYQSHKAASNDLQIAYDAAPESGEELLDSFFGQLDEAAERSRVVVLTAEAMAVFFWRGEAAFLNRLEAFGARHRVRVAYYVRPQHAALEAAWRQWGFCSGEPPSRYLAGHSERLHHYDTYASVRRSAPSVSFEPRPFRRDLLDLGDPAADFARRFLELEEPPFDITSSWANRGLSLEVANALRYAPPGLLYVGDEKRLGLVKQLLSDPDPVETEETRRSRAVLQAHCHEVFEPGNAQLRDALGWGIDHFVPPPEGEGPELEHGLAALDELWEPKASELELQALYLALEHAIAAASESRGSGGGDRSSKRDPARTDQVLAATLEDIAKAREELSRVAGSRTWRLSARLAGWWSALRGHPASSLDLPASLSERLAKTEKRVDRLTR